MGLREPSVSNGPPALLQVGAFPIWAPDHDILERVRFPLIRTLDTSKTPKAGEARLTAPVMAEANIANIKAMMDRLAQGKESGKSPKSGGKLPRAKAARLIAPVAPAAPSSAPKAVDASDLGSVIRQARIDAGLSQIDLAARLGTSQGNIVRLEKGRSQPTTRTLQKIADETGHRLAITYLPLQPPAAAQPAKPLRRKAKA